MFSFITIKKPTIFSLVVKYFEVFLLVSYNISWLNKNNNLSGITSYFEKKIDLKTHFLFPSDLNHLQKCNKAMRIYHGQPSIELTL